MAERHFDLTSADRTPLRATIWDVPSPAALVLWVHGFAEHRLRYGDFAGYLNGKGYAFACVDLRGHGDSGGARGFVRCWDDYLADVSALLEWFQRSLDEKPLILGSHSMGGLIAARFLERGEFSRPVDGAVFSAPFIGLGMPVPPWKAKLGAGLSRLIPGLSLPSGLDPSLLSHDSSIVKAYIDDPKIFTRATARWFTELGRAQALALAEASRIRLPVLVCQGMGDRIVSIEASRSFFDKLGSADRTWKGFDSLYHEILNEARPDRGAVYEEFGAWLAKRFPA